MRLISDGLERLDKFLSRSLPQHSRTKLAGLVRAGVVLVDGKTEPPSFELKPGMVVVLDEPEEGRAHDLSPAAIDLDVRFEDEFLLVVNKPRGLAVHPAPSLKETSLVNALLARTHSLSKVGEAYRPGIVHRLDKDTTGLLIVAKTDAAHVSLARQIERKDAKRRYLAVAAGTIENERFDVRAPISRSPRNRMLMAVDPRGKPASTKFKRLSILAEGSLLLAELETGRTHQIRVHLQSIGYPILGDRLYSPKRYQHVPLQLHATYLAFEHPAGKGRVEIIAEPPSDFLCGSVFDARSISEF